MQTFKQFLVREGDVIPFPKKKKPPPENSDAHMRDTWKRMVAHMDAVEKASKSGDFSKIPPVHPVKEDVLNEISHGKLRKYFQLSHSQMRKRDPKTYKKRMDGSVLALKKLDKDDDRVKVHASKDKK
jgi:hypothetical protein